jgi:hypothetical protein
MFLPPATSRAIAIASTTLFGLCAVIATAALLGLCAACTSQPQQLAEHHEYKLYRTGSNIPVKDYGAADNVTTVNPQAVRRAMGSALPGVTPGTVAPSGR